MNQNSANTKIYMKTLKRKITERERGFHYNSKKITVVIIISHALGFLSFFIVPLLVGGVYYLYM